MNCLKAIKYLLLVYKTRFFFIRALKTLICRNFKQICVSNFKHHLVSFINLFLLLFDHYFLCIIMFVVQERLMRMWCLIANHVPLSRLSNLNLNRQDIEEKVTKNSLHHKENYVFSPWHLKSETISKI